VQAVVARRTGVGAVAAQRSRIDTRLRKLKWIKLSEFSWRRRSCWWRWRWRRQ
jgi:hypothetical protein